MHVITLTMLFSVSLPVPDSERLRTEGLRRLKSADYGGAVAAFRSAIVESEGNPQLTAFFSLSLILSGDGKNADKALRAAVGAGFRERLDLLLLLKDEKEGARVRRAMEGVSGAGLFAAAWVEFLGGAPDRLKRLAETDRVAEQLLRSQGKPTDRTSWNPMEEKPEESS